MRVFNTLGRSEQPLEPIEPGKIGMYVCGPTVQASPHLGHGRFMVAFDAVRRYLVWRGFDVTFVQNVTDVDDKIINIAAERGISPAELATEVTDRFHRTSEALNNLTPDVEPSATEHIPEMLTLISTLVDNGMAYEAQGDVYFRVRSDEGYGKLSGRNLDDLVAGARVEPGEAKEDPLDFALWKAAKPDEPSWDSPWGPGRPGWHIECSAMSAKYLGASFDIHAGGSDLIFPHHENEIAQSEGASGRAFAKYWLHNGMLNLAGEKMSKSTGHIVALDDAIDTHGGAAVRLFYLRAHYRSPLEFSEDLLADAAASLDRLKAFRRRSGDVHADPHPASVQRFVDAMDDDFNTPVALSVLFEVVREGNRWLDRGESADEWVAAFDVIADVLGLDLSEGGLDDLVDQLGEVVAGAGLEPANDVAAMMDQLLERRWRARADKDWALADDIRDGLSSLGITIEDGADGTTWHRS